nr:uncharacterized protein LOC117833844 [Setaria viridis]
MDAEEGRLRLALLATAPGGPPDVPLDGLRRAIAELPEVADDNFAIRRFWLENFVVNFATQRARDAAMRAGSVPAGGVRLFFWPWKRLVRAETRTLLFRVSIELEGVPAHAWSMRTARKILSSSYWIERVEPATEERSDLTKMRVMAWTDDPCRIPRKSKHFIAEHEPRVVYDDPDMQRIFGNLAPYLRQKKTLSYDVIIHLRNVADFRSRSPSPSLGPSPPSSDGDSGHDGNPDRGYGESRGQGPRLHGYFTQEGVVDGDSPPAGETSSGRLRRRNTLPPPPVQAELPPRAPTAIPTSEPGVDQAHFQVQVPISPLSVRTSPAAMSAVAPPVLTPATAIATGQTRRPFPTTPRGAANPGSLPCRQDVALTRMRPRQANP